MADYAGTVLQVVGTVLYVVPGGQAFAPWVQAAGTALNAYSGTVTDPKKLPTMQPQHDQESRNERA